MLKARAETGLVNKINWKDGEDVMRWWIGDQTISGQLSFFDEEEVYSAMQEE